ncbi:MAG: SPOR domain-containing protein [Bacteroidota bacterium]
MKKIVLTLTLCYCVWMIDIQAQVTINEVGAIPQMMERYAEINKAITRLDGWRIQVTATTDRAKMLDEQQRFQYRYPNISIDWTHERPYYKVRAGAFASRLEALRLLSVVRNDYPSAYPVKDKNIRPAELIF